MRRTAIALSIIISISPYLMAGSAYAAPDSLPVVLTDQQLNQRLDEATQMLQSQQRNAEYWEYGWGGFDAGTMIWSAAQASREDDRKARGTDIVQASESLIGLADVIFRPLPAFNIEVCDDPLFSKQEKLQCLETKEQLLQDSAERAHEPYEMLPHLGNAGFNLLAGLIVWRIGGAGRALVTAVPGEIIGELQIWTTPSGPMADFNRYKMQFSPLLIETQHPEKPALGLGVSWHF